MSTMLCRALFVLLFVVAVPPAFSAGPAPAPSEREKCPVCGMFVAKYPDWAAAIQFNDGTRAAFDGPKDLFTYFLNLKRFNPGKSRDAVTAIRVKDYYSLATIDGHTAYYVVGSDVYGPMGKELVPFAKLSDARGFMVDHRGTRVVRLSEITPAFLKSLE
ncbi:nitrous oxide reductase accessory protein NosL [Geobacter sp. FeAm09]|uniref:nitrous oxide reductase accessory protein NosL n=1 Tax=Geobacter sp. FeAm09 TaxID=2597769 RepID=UPI0011EF3463|nr:nitrous oxide reductase accessory protein NosL [Geobacter sp. FeAm09]QEM68275.1 nitrous oxide reductase accessory protein NosL [Geobacter sp. FeAm09]